MILVVFTSSYGEVTGELEMTAVSTSAVLKNERERDIVDIKNIMDKRKEEQKRRRKREKKRNRTRKSRLNVVNLTVFGKK